jgi:hypothetical protein
MSGVARVARSAGFPGLGLFRGVTSPRVGPEPDGPAPESSGATSLLLFLPTPVPLMRPVPSSSESDNFRDGALFRWLTTEPSEDSETREPRRDGGGRVPGADASGASGMAPRAPGVADLERRLERRLELRLEPVSSGNKSSNLPGL